MTFKMREGLLPHFVYISLVLRHMKPHFWLYLLKRETFKMQSSAEKFNLKRHTVLGTGCATVRPVAPNSPCTRIAQATTSTIWYTHWRVPPTAPWTYPWLPLYSDRCKDSFYRGQETCITHTPAQIRNKT